MHIFLTGGTGFIGRALVLRLTGDGHRVTVWTRSPARARQLLGATADFLEVEDDGHGLRAALEDADGIVNLAGESIVGGRWTEARKRALVESRIGVTERLLEAVASCERRPRVLVSASAVGYYGDRDEQLLTEEDGPGQGLAAELCQRWEAAAMGATDLGLRVAIARIGVVIGRGGGALETMLPAFKLGLGGRLGSGQQYMSWVHIDDVVETLARALTDERMSGPFNVTAPHPVDNRTFAETLGQVLGRPTVIPTPALALRIALGEAAQVVLASTRVMPAQLLRLGYRFHFSELLDALDDVLDHRCHVDSVDHIPESSYLRDHRPRYMLHQETEIDAPIEQVFEFFSRAENLGAITPPSLAFEIETPSPIDMHEGTVIDYRIRVGPVPMRWRTVIERWQPGDSFVDSQAQGPYRAWWHEHRFIPDGERTRMEDRVYYAPPLGPLGRIAHRLVVAPMLRRVFDYRTQAIRHRFASRDAADSEHHAG